MKQIPPLVVEARINICKRCHTPCEKQADVSFCSAPCSTCPLSPRLWGPYGVCKNYGLGDLIHTLATPIAKAIDRAAGTKIQGCGGCAKRREALNNLVPSIGIKPSDNP